MTKKELIDKLDEIGGKFDEIREEAKSLMNRLEFHFNEIDNLQDILTDLPSNVDEITDEPLVNTSPVGESDE